MFASNTFSHTTLKVLLCLLVLVWTSCSTPKEEPQGEIGPEGPKGDKGPQGIQGLQGDQGADGKPGPRG